MKIQFQMRPIELVPGNQPKPSIQITQLRDMVKQLEIVGSIPIPICIIKHRDGIEEVFKGFYRFYVAQQLRFVEVPVLVYSEVSDAEWSFLNSPNATL